MVRKKFEGFKPLEYSVAKSGVIGFTKALASFYSGSNIKINCLILGGIKADGIKILLKIREKNNTK